jgi:hypothetical protein
VKGQNIGSRVSFWIQFFSRQCGKKKKPSISLATRAFVSPVISKVLICQPNHGEKIEYDKIQ